LQDAKRAKALADTKSALFDDHKRETGRGGLCCLALLPYAKANDMMSLGKVRTMPIRKEKAHTDPTCMACADAMHTGNVLKEFSKVFTGERKPKRPRSLARQLDKLIDDRDAALPESARETLAAHKVCF
jgi:hypothetical protein